jgi:hypothetical protein
VRRIRETAVRCLERNHKLLLRLFHKSKLRQHHAEIVVTRRSVLAVARSCFFEERRRFRELTSPGFEQAEFVDRRREGSI